ncbi:MAG: LacI family DNA-binding transcriptional regulator, partial [Chloroflexota bacterium]|nr:LacI family DNA-binding transcriptional regulator [Chloroflexota bacterium]
MPRKRVTSKDVAELAGVSRTTVSFVLNDAPGVKISEETRQRVLEAARQLNYYPASAARSLASGRTNAIGLVLCQSANSIFTDAFLPEVIHGLGEVAQESGFRILLESVEDVTQPEAYIALVREKYI